MRHDAENWRYYHEIDQNYYVLAGIFDAVNQNTIATGMFKKKPKIEPWPTPDTLAKKASSKNTAPTVASLFSRFGGVAQK